jgi:uncharacterized repeat protein (TIGR04138 family)
MPDPTPSSYEEVLNQVVEAEKDFPVDAYHFVQSGLQYAAQLVHGPHDEKQPDQNRHVSGQELAMGLRDYAIELYGPLARTVLRHWNIRSTFDFGRIVYAMINAGLLQKQESDEIDDFRDVFDFRTEFPDTISRA